MGYKHVWCYQRDPVLCRIKKRLVWRYPYKNWYNNSVAFHNDAVCVSELCLLTAYMTTQVLFWLCTYTCIWASSSWSCVHPGHHGLYQFIWLSFNTNHSPFWGKELNQSDPFSKQLSTDFAFTNMDWDSVTWGGSLTVIVWILNLSNMW